MTKITINSTHEKTSKNEFLKELNIAFATGDASFIINHAAEDIVWVLHGDKIIKGKEAFANEIHMMKEYVAEEFTIDTIISLGMDAALNGEMKMHQKTYAFCDIYRFESEDTEIIREMNSYVIQKSQ